MSPVVVTRFAQLAAIAEELRLKAQRLEPAVKGSVGA